MTAAYLASLLMFCVVMSFTPGPNNLMATSSGLTHGVRRTVPLILGVMAGFGVLMVASALGVGALLLADPRLSFVLRLLGAAYMLFLAWKLWRAKTFAETDARPPLRLWHGAVLQLVNPKAWMMAVTAVAVYVASVEAALPRLLFVTVLIELFSLASMLTWATFGSALRTALGEPGRARRFNRLMAMLAGATALLILFWK